MRINWGLVGRTDELDRIGTALATKSGGAVFINGAAGIGKTRLAREALTVAATAGAHTEWVAATRAASLLPFGALLQLISEPTDVLQMADTSPVAALSSALRARAGHRPVVLCIDDAHLLDEGAAAAVHYLASTGQARIVMTTREGEVFAEALTSLRKEDASIWVDLRRLSVGDVDELMTSVLNGPVAAETVTRLWQQSEGNPLMLREIVAQSLKDERFAHSGVLWHWDGLTTTGPVLHSLITEHLRRIPSEARRVLRLVGFGQPLDADVLHHLADLRTEALLVNEGLIEFEHLDHRLVVHMAHPLYAEFVRENTTVPEARQAMRDLAEATMAQGVVGHETGLQLARWWVDAGLPGDQEILATAAAHSLVLGNPSAAREFADAALAHGKHFGALLALAEAGRSSLDEDALWPLFEKARGRAANDAELATWAIAVLRAFPTNLSDPEMLATMADEVIGRLRDPTLQDLVRGQLATCFSAAGRSEESQALASKLLDSADDLVRIRALFVGSTSAILAGRGEGIDTLSNGLLEPSFQLEEQFPGTLDLVRMAKLGALLALGRFDDLRTVLDDYRSTGPSRVTPDFNCFAALLVGLTSLMRGHVRSATTELREAFDLSRSWKSTFVPWTGGLLVQALATQGLVDDAAQVAASIEDLPPAEPFDADRTRSATWLLVGRGELHAARDRFMEVADSSHHLGRHFHEMAALHDALRVGATDVALRLSRLAPQIEGEWAAACGAHANALLSGQADHLEAAGHQFESIGFELHAAEVLTQAASAYHEAGQRSSANRAGLRAHALLGHCQGAVTPLTTARLLIDPLTDRELQVATLAARGHSSRQIAEGLSISIRTVDNLLLRAYRKLGVGSRSELAAAMAIPTDDGAS